MRAISLVIICFSVLPGGYGLCQGNDTLAVLVPKSIIKFSPLHLLNHYPTIQLAYEHRLGRSLTTQVDLGYVVNLDQHTESFRHKRGFKFRVEPRYYFDSNFERNLLFYLAADYYFNRIDFDRSEQRQECFDVTCNHRYLRNYEYEVKYREMGSSFKFGKLKWYGNVVIDANVGLSLRHIRYHHPSGAVPLGGWFSIVKEHDRTTFSPYVSMRIGYRVR